MLIVWVVRDQGGTGIKHQVPSSPLRLRQKKRLQANASTLGNPQKADKKQLEIPTAPPLSTLVYRLRTTKGEKARTGPSLDLVLVLVLVLVDCGLVSGLVW